MKPKTATFPITIAAAEVNAIARVLNAKRAGSGYLCEDDDLANDLLTRIATRGALDLRIKSAAACELIAHDYTQFHKSGARQSKIGNRNSKIRS